MGLTISKTIDDNTYWVDGPRIYKENQDQKEYL